MQLGGLSIAPDCIAVPHGWELPPPQPSTSRRELQKIWIYTRIAIASSASINRLEILKIQATMWFSKSLHSLRSWGPLWRIIIDQHCCPCPIVHTSYFVFLSQTNKFRFSFLGYILIIESNSGVKHEQCCAVAWRYSQVLWSNLMQNIDWTICIAFDQGYFPTSFFWLLYLFQVHHQNFSSVHDYPLKWLLIFDKLFQNMKKLRPGVWRKPKNWLSEEFKRGGGAGLWSPLSNTMSLH